MIDYCDGSAFEIALIDKPEWRKSKKRLAEFIRLYESCKVLPEPAEKLLHEAYQIAGQITARIHGKYATEEQEIRLLDILAFHLPDAIKRMEETR